jgi:hypothetical protein
MLTNLSGDVLTFELLLIFPSCCKAFSPCLANLKIVPSQIAEDSARRIEFVRRRDVMGI